MAEADAQMTEARDESAGPSAAFPGIESNPAVCGGEPCLARTRIPVWVLEAARRRGVSDLDLLKSYPSIRPEDLAQAWAFVRSRPAEIEEQIQANEQA